MERIFVREAAAPSRVWRCESASVPSQAKKLLCWVKWKLQLVPFRKKLSLRTTLHSPRSASHKPCPANWVVHSWTQRSGWSLTSRIQWIQLFGGWGWRGLRHEQNRGMLALLLCGRLKGASCKYLTVPASVVVCLVGIPTQFPASQTDRFFPSL